MENDVRQQLFTLGASVLLGMNISLLYDLLRPFRMKTRRYRWLTHLLDTVFSLTVMVL